MQTLNSPKGFRSKRFPLWLNHINYEWKSYAEHLEKVEWKSKKYHAVKFRHFTTKKCKSRKWSIKEAYINNIWSRDAHKCKVAKNKFEIIICDEYT